MLPALNSSVNKSKPFSPENTLKQYRKVSQPHNDMNPTMQLRYAKKGLLDEKSIFPKSVKTGIRGENGHRLPNVALSKMERAITRGTNESPIMYQQKYGMISANPSQKTPANKNSVQKTINTNNTDRSSIDQVFSTATRVNTYEDERESTVNFITVLPGQ